MFKIFKRLKLWIYRWRNNIRFVPDQEKAGFNKYNHYQFGSNCCIICKRDRPLKELGLYCDICKN